MDTVFIYALNDPDTGRSRYIGKASDPYARYEEHLNQNPWQKTRKASWIRSLLKIGQNPILEILDEVPELEWELWEQQWIRLYRMLGFRLTNGTDGGDGCRATLEVRAKIGASSKGRTHMRGFRHSPKTIVRMSEAKKGKIFSQAHREALSEARKGQIFSDSRRANCRMAQQLRRKRERIVNGM